MSITLTAYPMAFLISPQEAKKVELKETEQSNSNDSEIDKSLATQNLHSIKVLTNIEFEELNHIMSNVDASRISSTLYNLSNGLKVEWSSEGKYLTANISGASYNMQALGEDFFQQLDSTTSRNVRLRDSSEYFYYTYETEYTSVKDIFAKLKEQGAKQIFPVSDTEIIAQLNGQDIKYTRPEGESNFLLEVDQKVSIVNIGMSENTNASTSRYNALTSLKIKTNIKVSELKTLLKSANYSYFEGNSQTPLKNTNAILNWIPENGYYTAEFTGANNIAITNEADIIFRKMNIAAGRDLRLVNNQATTVYTYNTNYTDKGILINTLTEHGASDMVETGDEITCKLFGMDMIYKKDDSNGAYVLTITQVSDKSECSDTIKDLNDEYGLNIQEMTYNKIKERLDAENMHLESETVLDDNSIVLTIEV